MNVIPKYHFYKAKYGEELLIDVVELDYITKYIETHPTHTLSYFDITFIEEGTTFFSINDKHYQVGPKDVIFSIPGEIRRWDTTNIPKGYVLIFEEEFLLTFFNDPMFLKNLSFFNPERITAKINIADIMPRIGFLIQNIIYEINNYQSIDKHMLRALLYETLLLLNREYNKLYNSNKENQNTPNRHLNLFINLVDKDYKNFHSIKYYAGELCITPNYLNEIVRKTMGINAKLYIQNKILLEVKKLLTYTDLSIAEISEELNFTSLSYFIRFFRNKTNHTPLQYRNNTKP